MAQGDWHGESQGSQGLSWRSPSILTTALLRDVASGHLMPVNIDFFNQRSRLGRGHVDLPRSRAGRRVTRDLKSMWLSPSGHTQPAFPGCSPEVAPWRAPVHHPLLCVEVSGGPSPSVSLTWPWLLEPTDAVNTRTIGWLGASPRPTSIAEKTRNLWDSGTITRWPGWGDRKNKIK